MLAKMGRYHITTTMCILAQVPAWTPSRGPGAPRRAAQCEVKPLFSVCVQLLVEYIDDVETLWGLPDAIKVRIFHAVNKHENSH